MELHRLPNWHEGLAQWAAENGLRRFQWGTWDCCLAAADGVYAMTAQDIAEGYRGRYASALGAARLIREAGGMQAMVTSVVGEPIGRNYASVGDLGIIRRDSELPTLALCNGLGWLAPAMTGLGVVPFEAAIIAWRV